MKSNYTKKYLQEKRASNNSNQMISRIIKYLPNQTKNNFFKISMAATNQTIRIAIISRSFKIMYQKEMIALHQIKRQFKFQNYLKARVIILTLFNLIKLKWYIPLSRLTPWNHRIFMETVFLLDAHFCNLTALPNKACHLIQITTKIHNFRIWDTYKAKFNVTDRKLSNS